MNPFLALMNGWEIVLIFLACSGTCFVLLLAVGAVFIWTLRRVGREKPPSNWIVHPGTRPTPEP
jgi:hypothetical protein